MSRDRSVKDIAEVLRRAKDNGRGAALLIGAGCSVTADIPTADQFVKIIKKNHKQVYQRAEKKTYPSCMAEFLPGERRELIAHYVDRAKINWAHVCIALLMKHGYIDRVLTTNFDPLVVRAGAMIGEFPAVYDFAASQLLKPADIPDKAVFYLHGQSSGFVLMNTQSDLDEHSERLGPLFQDAGRGRMWIVSSESSSIPRIAMMSCRSL